MAESNPSPDTILARAVAPLFDRALDAVRVVVVTGPRQVGKSTFVRTHPRTADRPYLTLDDAATRLRARDDPRAFVRSERMLTIDEIQRDPELILAIKTVVDTQRPAIRGQFVLTGSANLLLMQRVADSLAGRAYYTRLWPLTRREQRGLGTTGIWSTFFDTPAGEWRDRLRAETDATGAMEEPWPAAVRRGGFPEPAHEITDDAARELWADGYITTYLERDLRDLRAVERVGDVQRLMRAAALRVGNLLNQTELARDTGMPPTTVHDYLNILETSYQIVRLTPYTVNRTSRLIKTPKLYWNDAALALRLAGGQPTGAHLENLVLSDLLAWRDSVLPGTTGLRARPPEVTYWRTAAGREVDFVLEWGDHLVAVEVKATTNPGTRNVAGLAAFCAEYGKRVRGGLLLHGGTETFSLGDRVVATPWWRVL